MTTVENHHQLTNNLSIMYLKRRSCLKRILEKYIKFTNTSHNSKKYSMFIYVVTLTMPIADKSYVGLAGSWNAVMFLSKLKISAVRETAKQERMYKSSC